MIAQWGIVPSGAQPHSSQLYCNQLYSRVGSGGSHFETSVIGGPSRTTRPSVHSNVRPLMHIEGHQMKSLCKSLSCEIPIQGVKGITVCGPSAEQFAILLYMRPLCRVGRAMKW